MFPTFCLCIMCSPENGRKLLKGAFITMGQFPNSPNTIKTRRQYLFCSFPEQLFLKYKLKKCISYTARFYEWFIYTIQWFCSLDRSTEGIKILQFGYPVILTHSKAHYIVFLWNIRENNVKMDLKGIRCKVIEWIHLAHDMDQQWALVNTVMHLQLS
jgi:hypothetical protein